MFESFPRQRDSSKSIALDNSSTVTFTNRALAGVRLSKFCQATVDCTEALDLDPMCAKARCRRAIIHHKCGRYLEAKEDFSICVDHNPNNKEYSSLMNCSTEKLLELHREKRHEESKKKIDIEEEGGDSAEKEQNCNIIQKQKLYQIPKRRIVIVEEEEESSDEEDQIYDDIEEVYTPGIIKQMNS